MHWVEGVHEFPALISDGLTLATKRRAIISDIAGRFALNQVIDAYRKLESDPHGKVLVLPGLWSGGRQLSQTRLPVKPVIRPRSKSGKADGPRFRGGQGANRLRCQTGFGSVLRDRAIPAGGRPWGSRVKLAMRG